jgi:hypothetical protein
MPRRPADDPDDHEEDWDESDEWEDDPDDLPDGVYHDDDIPTIPCPYCQREISEEAQWCPHCENHVSKEDAPPPRRTWFWVVMMALALTGVAWWVLG